MARKFSYSRIGCFKDCPRKYQLKYVTGINVDQETQTLSDVSAKGLAFHEFAEHYDPKWTEEEILAQIRHYEEEYPEGKAFYPLEPRVRKFIDMFKEKALPFEKGIFRETWLNGTIAGEEFCGAIDLLIEHGDGKVDIIDYKSAKTAQASKYKGQLLLYAYLYAKMKDRPIDDIENWLTLTVFFPFNEEESYEKCFKKLRLKGADVMENVKEIEEKLLAIKARDWSNVDPMDVHLDSTCAWCEFLGHPEYCPITYKAGYRVPRGTVYVNYADKEHKK